MDDPADLGRVRQLVLDRSRALNLTLTDLSRHCGKNLAYVHQFLYKRSPKLLPEDVREGLAQILGLNPNDLRETPPPPPMSANPVVRLLPPLEGRHTDGHTPPTTIRDVPVFGEADEIEPARALEWTHRPAGSAATGATFAVWITEPRARLRPGDIAFVRAAQPPGIGDLVVVLRGKRIHTIGELVALDHDVAKVAANDKPETIRRADHRILKVINVAMR